MRCEKCGSARVQLAPSVYRRGRQHVPRRLLPGPVQAPAYAAAGTAARLASPPRMRSPLLPFLGFIAVALMLGLSAYFGWIGAALAGLLLVGTLAMLAANSVYNRTAYPDAYRRWKNSCMCLDCGHVFEHRH